MLAGVIPEELLVQVAADGSYDHVFAGQYRGLPLAHPLEQGFDAFPVQVQPIELVYGVQVDGDWQQLAVYVGERAVLVPAPFGEVGEVIYDAPRVGVEDMRPVAVYQDAVLVVLVICVPPDVGAPVDHVDPLARARQTLGNDAAGIARAYHQDVGLHDVPSRDPNNKSQPP